jgi:hypothetical protein
MVFGIDNPTEVVGLGRHEFAHSPRPGDLIDLVEPDEKSEPCHVLHRVSLVVHAPDAPCADLYVVRGLSLADERRRAVSDVD